MLPPMQGRWLKREGGWRGGGGCRMRLAETLRETLARRCSRRKLILLLIREKRTKSKRISTSHFQNTQKTCLKICRSPHTCYKIDGRGTGGGVSHAERKSLGTLNRQMHTCSRLDTAGPMKPGSVFESQAPSKSKEGAKKRNRWTVS